MLGQQQSRHGTGSSSLVLSWQILFILQQFTLSTVNGQAYCAMKEPINGRFDQPCLPLPGRICKFNCFKLDGSAVHPFMSKRVICMPNLQWSPAPYCDSSGSFTEPNFQKQPRPGDSTVLFPDSNSPKPACPDLNPPEAGYSEGKCVNASMNDVCVFGCLPGYVKEGGSSVKCLGDRWSGKMPVCKMTPCTVTNLNDHLPGAKANDISCFLNPKLNATCSIKCNTGWSSNGNTNGSSQCTPDGWVPPLRQVCQEVICNDLTNTSFVNGKFTGYCSQARYNQFCSFSCVNGYYLEGDTLAICTMAGTWKPQKMPRCVNPNSLPTSTSPSPPTNATGPTKAPVTPNPTGNTTVSTETTTSPSQIPPTGNPTPPVVNTSPTPTVSPSTNGPQVNQTNPGQVRGNSSETITKDLSTTLGTTTELAVTTVGSTATTGTMATGGTKEASTQQGTINSPLPPMSTASSVSFATVSQLSSLVTLTPPFTTQFTTQGSVMTTIFALPSTNQWTTPITQIVAPDSRMTTGASGVSTVSPSPASSGSSINVINNNNVQNVVNAQVTPESTKDYTTPEWTNHYTTGGSRNDTSVLTTPMSTVLTTSVMPVSSMTFTMSTSNVTASSTMSTMSSMSSTSTMATISNMSTVSTMATTSTASNVSTMSTMVTMSNMSTPKMTASSVGPTSEVTTVTSVANATTQGAGTNPTAATYPPTSTSLVPNASTTATIVNVSQQIVTTTVTPVTTVNTSVGKSNEQTTSTYQLNGNYTTSNQTVNKQPLDRSKEPSPS